MALVDKKVKPFKLNAFKPGAEDFVTVSSYDISGKWSVFFFYPADFTFVCPTELEELADMYDEFTKIGAEVISMSTDKAFTHKAWHDKSPAISKVRFPMGADPTGQISKSLGVYI